MAVNFVKQAPAWKTGVSAAFTPVLGLSPSNLVPNPAGDTVAAVFGPAFFDAAGVATGIAITSLTGTSDGAWQFSTDDGGTWTNVPTVSMTNALLLASSVKLRFLPNKKLQRAGHPHRLRLGRQWQQRQPDNRRPRRQQPVRRHPLVANCLVNNAPTLAAK